MHSPTAKGTLLAILSGLLYGAIGYYGTMLFQAQFSVPNLLCWRFALAALCMVPAVILRNRGKPLPSWHTLYLVFLIGGVLYSSGAALYFLSVTKIGTGLSMVLFFTYPAFVVLFMWALTKKHPRILTVLSIATILFGCCLIALQKGVHFNLLGVSFAILSATTYAIYIIVSMKTTDRIDPYSSTLLVCLASAIVFFIAAQVDGSFHMPSGWRSWYHAIALGVLATALPIVFFLESLKYISAGRASILSVLEPVVTVPIGVFLLSEAISSSQIWGVLFVLAGAVAIQWEKEEDK
jgi:drug/metabolite transporter (DMT)-like permease